MNNISRKSMPSLPNVEFVETDTQALQNKLISEYEKMADRKLYPADPILAFINWMASIIVQERIQMNESAKQNLPRYAEGENLDSLAEIFHNTERLKAKAAETTLRFQISKSLDEVYVISDTQEVTYDGEISFVTEEPLVFKPGEVYTDVRATCTVEGEIGNGFSEGKLNKLVSEEFMFFKNVSNITKTDGGSDIETDIEFYNRLRESEETYSTAGPVGSYIYHVKTVSQLINDVSVTSSTPGVVDIRIMTKNGIPDHELLKKVELHLNKDDIRPLTDIVTVSTPSRILFEVDVIYYIAKEITENINELQKKIEAAVDTYITWQTSKMGRDINPSMLSKILMDVGVKRVVINKPEFCVIEKKEVAVMNEKKIAFGGIEDE